MSITSVDMRNEVGPFGVSAIADGYEIAGPELAIQITQGQLDDISAGIVALTPAAPTKIVFMGDSVTVGVRSGVVAADTFVHKVGAARGFDVVINRGVGGENSAEMLTRFATAVVAENPDAVCIMAGINDYYDGLGAAAYEANIGAMVGIAKGAGIPATVCSPNLVRDSIMIAAFQPWLDALTRIGEIDGVTLVNIYQDWVWANFTLSAPTFTALYVAGEDPSMHPGPTGHTRIANAILANPNACRKPSLV